MAPKPASRASKPASKAAPASKAKAPVSKAAPASKAAATEKPVSNRVTKPVPARPASSRRGAAPAAATPAPENEEVKESAPVANGTPKSRAKANGHSAKVTAEADQKALTGAGKTAAPAPKKGRAAQLIAEEPAAKRRRSSVGMVQINAIPQPPPRSGPHRALFVFGTGDMGQFGLGPDELDEIARPKLHEKFEELIADNELTGLEAVACGGMHTLAIDEKGQIWSWGINDNAALGRKTTDVPSDNDPAVMKPNDELESNPMVIESLIEEPPKSGAVQADAGAKVKKPTFRAVQVDAGDSISVALSDDGQLRAWGSFRSNDGILGFDGNAGSSQFQWTPMAIPALQKEKLVSVSCGADHVLALTTTGRVWVWGNGQQNQLGRRIIERRKINGLAPERLGLKNIVLASTGAYHSFAVNNDGQVYAWGLNSFHQTGVAPEDGGNDDMIISPTEVTSLRPSEHDGARVIQIEGGEHHTIFLFDNGEVWGCGRADANQIGIGKDHPAQAGLAERREEIKAEKQKKVESAQKQLDTVKEAQRDEEEVEDAERELLGAQASLAAAMDEYVPEPVRIYFPPIPESYEVVPEFPSYDEIQSVENAIAHISSGTRHILAVSKSGHVYSWGLGMGAQLGLGKEESAEVPTLVRSKSLRPYTAIYASAGGQHCVLLGKLGDPHAASA